MVEHQLVLSRFTLQHISNKTAVQRCFKLQLLLQHYEPVFFYVNALICDPYDTPTFKTKLLCLVSNVQRL